MLWEFSVHGKPSITETLHGKSDALCVNFLASVKPAGELPSYFHVYWGQLLPPSFVQNNDNGRVWLDWLSINVSFPFCYPPPYRHTYPYLPFSQTRIRTQMTSPSIIVVMINIFSSPYDVSNIKTNRWGDTSSGNSIQQHPTHAASLIYLPESQKWANVLPQFNPTVN